jgi:predicted enzyme related to lactoylglutathione lyase
MPVSGEFCWNELATTDAEAAKKFYADLFGWEYKVGDVEGVAYSEIMVGGRPVGGIHQMGAEFSGAPPHWTAYVAVSDVDAAARKVEELGGKVCVPPTDIPNVGRFCVINDPAGATMSLIKMTHPM